MSDAQTGSRIAIRAPQAGDVRSLEEAERACFPDPWPGHYFLAELYAPGRFQRLAVDATGELAGYLFAAWQYLDLHVLKVATLPPYRRAGLARRLLQLAQGHAREHGGESVTLEVRVSNAAAIELYRAEGYVEAGQRRRYYSDGEDALVMTRRVGWTDVSSVS